MTYNPIIFNESSSSSKANDNWVHAGRFGFTSFYGMDIDGNYVSQDLGELTKKWKDIYMSGVANIANIKIDGNTISSTDTDGDINLTPDGTGKVVIKDVKTNDDDLNLDTGTGRTKITRLIGDTGSEQNLISHSLGTSGTNVQATKDIMVFLYKVTQSSWDSSSKNVDIQFKSDSGSTPSTLYYSKNFITSSALVTYQDIGFCWLVKKGDYYRVEVKNNSSNSTSTAYWLEIEIGA
jgi:hypothetical protein